MRKQLTPGISISEDDYVYDRVVANDWPVGVIPGGNYDSSGPGSPNSTFQALDQPSADVWEQTLLQQGYKPE